MSKRVIMRIELTGSAKDRLTDFCDRQGMTQVAVMSRLTEWFANQNLLIQSAVLGNYPQSIAADVAKLILIKMVPPGKMKVAKKRASMPEEQS